MVELLAMTLGGTADSAEILRKIQNSAKKAKCDYGQAPGDSVAGELSHAFAGRSSTGASSIRMLVFLRIRSSRFLDR